MNLKTFYFTCVCCCCLAILRMGPHICNRDDCGFLAVSGPKVKCAKCDRICFLTCYGFAKSGMNGVKFSLESGAAIGFKINSLVFTCNNCDSVFLNDAISELPDNLPKPKLDEKEAQTQTSSIEKMANDIADLKSAVSELTKNVNSKFIDMTAVTPTNQSLSSLQFPTMAQALRANLNSPSYKRKLGQTVSQKVNITPKLPQQKKGTRTGNVGLDVAPNPKPSPKFAKSIHISRIATSVTIDKITEYVCTSANIQPNVDFRCTLLVKRDKDLSTLSFISYKIDVTEDKFDQLMNVDFWPEGVLIRQFVPIDRQPIQFANFSATSPNEIPPPKKIDPKNVLPSANEPITVQQEVMEVGE